jgi:hypothetical protein
MYVHVHLIAPLENNEMFDWDYDWENVLWCLPSNNNLFADK